MEQIRLDKIDKKILFELDKNSHQSFSELGKKVRLKKETVFQRVKKLQENGVIEQFQTIINVNALGYQNYRLLIKLKKVDEKTTLEILEFFIKSKNVGWVVKCEGNWDLGVWYQIKDLYNFKNEYESFKQKFANFISKEKLSIFTEVVRYSKSFLIDKENSSKMNINLLDKKYDLNELDEKLLKFLAENSRISLIELSEKLNLSTKTIVKKIKILEKNNIILGYGIKINIHKIGYSHFKIHLKLDNLDEKIMKEFQEYIFRSPNIIWLNNSISGFDLDLDVNIETYEMLSDLLNKMKNHFKKNIDEYEILSYTKEYKQIFM